MSVDLSAEAQSSWLYYRDDGAGRNLGRRQMRRREFIAGYVAAEAAVRAQIAARLDALAEEPDSQRDTEMSGGLWQGYHDSARIARGESL